MDNYFSLPTSSSNPTTSSSSPPPQTLTPEPPPPLLLSSSPPPIRSVDWASLPDDVLGIVTDYFASGREYRNFRCTCKKWGRFSPIKPFAPRLMVKAEDSGIYHFLVSYHDVLVSSPLRFRLPPCVVVSSSRGYIVLECDTRGVILFNPVIGSSIQLPSVGEFSIYKLVLSGDPNMADDWSAVAIYENVYGMVQFSLFQSKINAWISLPSPKYTLHMLSDCDVEHFNGSFYLITAGLIDYRFNPCFTLFSWILHPDASHISLTCLCKNKEIFIDAGFYTTQYYLVDCAGSLLIVAMSDSEFYKMIDTDSDDSVENNDIGDDYVVVENIRMPVFRVVWHQRLEFELLLDLGGHALFVGRNQSFSVDTGKYPGLRRDSIYSIVNRPIYSIVNRADSIQIFSLPHETCWVRPIAKSYRWSPLAWLLGRSS